MAWGSPATAWASAAAVSPWKVPVRVATQVDVADLAAGAPLLVDGEVLVAGDRVLVPNQILPATNGIYRVAVPGTGANGQWARASDADATGELRAGAVVQVTEGATDADRSYVLVTDDPIEIGVTAQTWARQAAPGTSPLAVELDHAGGLAVGDPVYVDTTNHVAPADAAVGGQPASHVVTQLLTATRCRAAAAGGVVGYAGLVAGTRYYLAPGGGLTATPPAPGTGQLLQQIAVALSTTTVELRLDATPHRA